MNDGIEALEAQISQIESRMTMIEQKESQISELKLRIKFAISEILEGGCDGEHHKQRALDQALRALVGCPLEEVNSIDCRGNAYSYQIFGQSPEYIELLSKNGYSLEQQVADYEDEHQDEYMNGDYCIWGV